MKYKIGKIKLQNHSWWGQARILKIFKGLSRKRGCPSEKLCVHSRYKCVFTEKNLLTANYIFFSPLFSSSVN